MKPERYLAMLRRIPDDIVLAIAAQDFDERYGTRCVCGWAVRESVARAAGVDADTTEPSWHEIGDCADRFGGSFDEWEALYYGAETDTPNVERAFVDRLNEIVR